MPALADFRLPNKIAPFAFASLAILGLVVALSSPQRALSPMGPTTKGDQILGYIFLTLLFVTGTTLYEKMILR